MKIQIIVSCMAGLAIYQRKGLEQSQAQSPSAGRLVSVHAVCAARDFTGIFR